MAYIVIRYKIALRGFRTPKVRMAAGRLRANMTPMVKKSRQPGGPLGNQHARKHGFYARYLTPEEQAELLEATMVEGLDEEIALMRVKIQGVLKHDPNNLELVSRGMSTLANLVRTKYNLSKDDRQGIKEAVAGVLKDIALPLGLGLSNFIGK